ncbi:MAG: DUF4974 domain-containing protein [Odoribacteraceae bacterium]|jgi:ferric-dicitrate binding protein FerR (iron transport regulator)|nr:DUF4974 domain-containing protein [Odoribacteraceae bacterium]
MTENTRQRAYRIARLLLGKHRRPLAPAEEEELARWLAEGPRNRETARRLERFPTLLEGLRFFVNTDAGHGWRETARAIARARQQRARRQRARWGAAVVLLLLGAGLVLLARQHEPTPSPRDIARLPTPERRGILLQLSDGEVIALDRTASVKERDGQEVASNDTASGLVYRPREETGEGLRHTIIAPRGTECKLTLSDGSIVHLNSDTRLTYPVTFPAGKRVVEMTGEAYFEVAKRDAPFIIKSGEIEVEVTGTAFNIEAYPDEETIRATLVSGTIDVRAGDSARVRLAPSHQARFSRSSRRLTSAPVETRPHVAWRAGDIYLDGERLEEITRRLERWYDVTFTYDNAPGTRDLRFRGTIKRHEHVSRVLAMLELTNLISFTLTDDKTIQVNPCN